MKPNITTPLIALMLMLAFSCGSPCDDTQVITKDEFADDKIYIPYKGYDTLTFLKNSKDTIMLINNGRQEFLETVYVGQGECSVKHRLKHHVYDFNTQAGNLKFTAHYFIYTENQGFIDMYEAKINDAPIIKPVDAFMALTVPKFPMSVLGVNYDYVLTISNIPNDSLYLAGGLDPKKRIVRIKHLNDVYEILP